MQEQLKKRLTSLKGEFEAGERLLAELNAKETKLRESLLRISGAIQVLEEELAREDNVQQLVPGASRAA